MSRAIDADELAALPRVPQLSEAEVVRRVLLFANRSLGAAEIAEAKVVSLQRHLTIGQPEAKYRQAIAAWMRPDKMLPKAADAYRRQIEQGLDGDPRAALKARVILRELFGGKIRLVPEADGALWAEYNLRPAALLKAAGASVGSSGSGGRI